MLRHLQIRNFAVVEELDLEFGAGMTVFTGETGAGKSILIDALGLILGDRADSGIIRGEAARAEIAATFETGPGIPGLAELLAGQELAADGGEILIRRVVGRDGRSRGFINGAPVAVQTLRAVGECLVDVHGQHEHQSLAKRDVQRDLLDQFGGHEAELAAVRRAAADWREAARALEEIGSSGAIHEAELALLRYQIDELTAADLKPDEFAALEAEYRRLSNASRLQEALQGMLAGLYEGEVSVHARAGRALRELQELARIDAALAPPAELLDGALIQIGEATDGLRDYLEKVDLDPARLGKVESRLDELHALARKHHIQPRDLCEHFAALKAQLRALENSSVAAADLAARQAEALARYATAAAALRKRREAAAREFGRAVTAQMKKLGMPDGRFSVQLAEAPAERPQAHGADQVEYLVGINPGQPDRPLTRVASGGELSRISLAIQVAGGRDSGIPTLIFDEVDAGVGGAIAEVVGRLLRQLAAKRQVICVTHLPQVAALSNHHFLVAKTSEKKNTWTTATALRDRDREEEIARMLGGMKISDKTRAHAREMLRDAERAKS
jgi:DNA repair protein RecN (Recombination protein N)